MEPTEEIVWFYIRDHQQQGPVGFFELRKLLEQGILSGDTFIWKKDLDNWQMARSVSPLAETVLKTIPDDVQGQKNYAIDWEEIKKDTYPNGRPFVRYVARFFDLSLFSIVLITFVSIFSPRFITDSSGFTLFMLSLILYILVEASILTVFGNTLGKALLNTKLKTVNGNRIDFLTALKRSIFVNAAGMGFGVPFINFVCFIFSYFDLKKNGKSTWDKQIGTIILYGQVPVGRVVFVSLFPFAMLVAGFVI